MEKTYAIAQFALSLILLACSVFQIVIAVWSRPTIASLLIGLMFVAMSLAITVLTYKEFKSVRNNSHEY